MEDFAGFMKDESLKQDDLGKYSVAHYVEFVAAFLFLMRLRSACMHLEYSHFLAQVTWMKILRTSSHLKRQF